MTISSISFIIVIGYQILPNSNSLWTNIYVTTWFARQSDLMWVHPLSVISGGLDKLLLTGLLCLWTVLTSTFLLAGYLGTVHLIWKLCGGLAHDVFWSLSLELVMHHCVYVFFTKAAHKPALNSRGERQRLILEELIRQDRFLNEVFVILGALICVSRTRYLN